MKAIVKSMWVSSPTIDLDDYFPEDPGNFSLWIEFSVGPSDSTGANDYRVLVCTPEWLCQNIWEPRWGRHMLIVREYDHDRIVSEIRRYVEGCTGKDFWEIAQKVARIGAWEFEDYQS